MNSTALSLSLWNISSAWYSQLLNYSIKFFNIVISSFSYMILFCIFFNFIFLLKILLCLCITLLTSVNIFMTIMLNYLLNYLCFMNIDFWKCIFLFGSLSILFSGSLFILFSFCISILIPISSFFLTPCVGFCAFYKTNTSPTLDKLVLCMR